MFDWYIPDPPLHCPVCGAPLNEWQGKDGPRARFVWRQGQAAPVDQCVGDEIKAKIEDRDDERLPERFEIYSDDCRCNRLVHAVGHCTDDVWTVTEILTPANAVLYPQESPREFAQRTTVLRKWLEQARET
jgi:hypothetical protein